MGQAKLRRESIAKGLGDPGNDGRQKKMKKITFIVTPTTDGKGAQVTLEEGEVDHVSLLYIWVNIMDAVCQNVQGDSKGLNFVRKVRDEFNSEFRP